jgi:hypothetical protein
MPRLPPVLEGNNVLIGTLDLYRPIELPAEQGRSMARRVQAGGI